MDRSSYPFEIAIALLVFLGLIFVGTQVATRPAAPATQPAATQSASEPSRDEVIAVLRKRVDPVSSLNLTWPAPAR